MVGDFIRLKESKNIVVVEAIDYDGNVSNNHIIDFFFCEGFCSGEKRYNYAPDCFEPIPLTPEILEKNGFESNKNVFGGMNYALNADFFIENRGDRFCLSRIMAGHKYSTFWVCDIHYVHELQHCLKLVGIDKEITI